MDRPETRYAKSGDVHIAYNVQGSGDIDMIALPWFVSNLDAAVPNREMIRNQEVFGTFARLISYDKRGTGLSDRVDPGSVEDQVDDVLAVLDAVGSERAVLFGAGSGGQVAILFAATHPERTIALVLATSFARRLWAADYPWGTSEADARDDVDRFARDWGTGLLVAARLNPAAGEEELARSASQWASYERACASPGAIGRLRRQMYETDVRHVLEAIRVPTLITHPADETRIPEAHSRYLTEHIAGAKHVTLPGLGGENAAAAEFSRQEITEFLTGARPVLRDRVLATVLFTDIVGSTERAAELGDKQWRSVLERHDDLASREIGRFRGQRVKTMGDGLLATFDGPGRAVRCACAIRDVVRDLGVEIRAGLHTGEIEVLGEDVGGIAVHIGQRVSAIARPNEVLVSSTVVDLVSGAGLEFEDRGDHELKGVPRPWRLYAVR